MYAGVRETVSLYHCMNILVDVIRCLFTCVQELDDSNRLVLHGQRGLRGPLDRYVISHARRQPRLIRD